MRPGARKRWGGKYAIYLSVQVGALGDDAIGGLKKVGQDWIVEGRGGYTNPIDEVKHQAGFALLGTVEVGRYGENGNGYEGTQSTEIGYLESNRRVVEVVANAEMESDASVWFLRILNSARVLKR